MSDLLIIKNISREGPGLLEGVLRDCQVTYDVVDLDKGEQFPALDYKALVVLGGPDSANDASDKMTLELTKVREALQGGLPYLGICLGLQVGVKAAGGQVVPGAQKEIGFINPEGSQYVVAVTDAGKQDPLLAGLSSPLRVFQLHGEVVELANDMQLLATAPGCANQVIKIAEKAYGIQSHFELTSEMLRVWAEQDPDLQPIGYDKLQKDFAAIRAEYTTIGETLLRNFLRIAGLAN